jgi:hypothetical protein
MAILSTGPIENRPVGGVRPTQQVTIKMVNRDSANSSTVIIRGFHLNGTRTLYVLETVTLTPNEVVTRNYFANFDAFQFVFTTSGPAAESTEISVWGKSGSGELVTAHRLVSDELLGSEMAGPTGPQSAFRAVRNTPQPLTAGDQQIIYTDEQLDTNNEYDPATGKFTPQQDGIYFIIASVGFKPAGETGEYSVNLGILVNSNTAAQDFEFSPGSDAAISVSTILPLQADDVVDVFIRSPEGATDPIGNITRFEGARIS